MCHSDCTASSINPDACFGCPFNTYDTYRYIPAIEEEEAPCVSDI